jgi:hypothetical protein
MVVTERITMTMQEVDRFKVIQDVTEGRLKPWRAAERLGLTTRQIRRLATRYRESGAAGLVSRKRGMPGNRRLDDELAQCPGHRPGAIRRFRTDAGLREAA